MMNIHYMYYCFWKYYFIFIILDMFTDPPWISPKFGGHIGMSPMCISQLSNPKNLGEYISQDLNDEAYDRPEASNVNSILERERDRKTLIKTSP